MPNANPSKTFTEVLASRKRANIPDMSFDLDGDGIVGNRDLVLSKLFDKDGDGKLNAKERKNAEEAIKNVSVKKEGSSDRGEFVGHRLEDGLERGAVGGEALFPHHAEARSCHRLGRLLAHQRHVPGAPPF